MIDIIIDRINTGLCPVCKEPIEDDEVAFIDYKGSKQPLHNRHIKFEETNA